MPRRPPPTALRLATGPIPPRYQEKHVLPSVPLPTFHPHHIWESDFVYALAHRQAIERPHRLTHRQLSSLDIPFRSGLRSGNTSPISAGSMGGARRKMISRGPWDHSGSISLEFDVESVLAPLKPVVVSPGGSC
jgi:hypothetical protein